MKEQPTGMAQNSNGSVKTETKKYSHSHHLKSNGDDQMVSQRQFCKTTHELDNDQAAVSQTKYLKTRRSDKEAAALQGPYNQTTPGASLVKDTGRERLKRHRVEVAGRVWIPDLWGQEELLKDWIDCTAFDASLGNNNIMSARAALVEGRRASSSGLRIENRNGEEGLKRYKNKSPFSSTEGITLRSTTASTILRH